MANEQLWIDFGKWFRERRKQAHLTQTETARRAGITRQHIYDIEKGNTGVKRQTVITLAEVLQADMDEALHKAGFSRATELTYEPDYEDLPPDLQRVHAMQARIVKTLPPGPQREAYLRKLAADTEAYAELARVIRNGS